MSNLSGTQKMAVALVAYWLTASPAIAAMTGEHPFWTERPQNSRAVGAVFAAINLYAGLGFSYRMVHFVEPHAKLLVGLVLLFVAAGLWIYSVEGSTGSATVERGKLSFKGGISFVIAFAGVLLIIADILPLDRI